MPAPTLVVAIKTRSPGFQTRANAGLAESRPGNTAAAKRETHAGGSLCCCSRGFSRHPFGPGPTSEIRRPNAFPALKAGLRGPGSIARVSKPEQTPAWQNPGQGTWLLPKERPTQVGLCVLVGAALAATSLAIPLVLVQPRKFVDQTLSRLRKPGYKDPVR